MYDLIFCFILYIKYIKIYISTSYDYNSITTNFHFFFLYHNIGALQKISKLFN